MQSKKSWKTLVWEGSLLCRVRAVYLLVQLDGTAHHLIADCFWQQSLDLQETRVTVKFTQWMAELDPWRQCHVDKLISPGTPCCGSNQVLYLKPIGLGFSDPNRVGHSHPSVPFNLTSEILLESLIWPPWEKMASNAKRSVVVSLFWALCMRKNLGLPSWDDNEW